MATGKPRFSQDDLMLIRIMPNATVGNHMTLPSGLRTNGQTAVLTNDFSANVALVWSIIEDTWEQPPVVAETTDHSEPSMPRMGRTAPKKRSFFSRMARR